MPGHTPEYQEAPGITANGKIVCATAFAAFLAVTGVAPAATTPKHHVKSVHMMPGHIIENGRPNSM